jgi:hypothetical protein
MRQQASSTTASATLIQIRPRDHVIDVIDVMQTV